MSRRVKVLAALNVLGWLVAVPLLLVALVDPFVDFSDWPDRVIDDRRGDVQLRTPAAEPGSQVKRESARSRARRAEDDPLEAAREALAQFAPAVGAGGAAGPGAGGGGTGPGGGGSDPSGGGFDGRGTTPIGESEPGTGGGVPGAAPTVPIPFVPVTGSLPTTPSVPVAGRARRARAGSDPPGRRRGGCPGARAPGLLAPARRAGRPRPGSHPDADTRADHHAGARADHHPGARADHHPGARADDHPGAGAHDDARARADRGSGAGRHTDADRRARADPEPGAAAARGPRPAGGAPAASARR